MALYALTTLLLLVATTLGSPSKCYVAPQVAEKPSGAMWLSVPKASIPESPWPLATKPVVALNPTSFQVAHNRKYIFIKITANDDAVITPESIDKETDIRLADRVEIGFSADDSLNHYVMMEVDARGRVMDYQAKPFRQFDFSWQFDRAVVSSIPYKKGYMIDITFPIQALKDHLHLNVATLSKLTFGVFRADFHSSKPPWQVSWRSWQNPGTDKPDFHTPAAWGCLVLQYGEFAN